jgi:hypothetical protein
MSQRAQSISRPTPTAWLGWLIALALLGACLLLLAWVSSGFQDLASWGVFAPVLLAGAALLWAGWRAMGADQRLELPAWLGWLMAGAALLRLVAGMVWFVALPAGGYGNPAESLGYVMADAHQRDVAAWKLAQSDRPLTRAFSDYRMADQYGGLLFLSGFVYRYFGGPTHHPLQIVVLTAAFSALAVVFTWAFSRRLWGAAAANASAVVLALYPEAVLLGSSQMREAFSMSLVMAAFYGLARYWQDRDRASLAWILGALVLTLPISPPFTALLLGFLVLQLLWMGKVQFWRQRRIWIGLGLLALLAGVGIWLAWDRFAPVGVNNPLALIGWWLRRSTGWQAPLSESTSGWIQKIFDRFLPAWAQIPFLVLYGVVRPFLPAALVDTSAPIWKAIGIWRSLGWAVLLILLVYATWRAWSGVSQARAVRGLSVVIWGAVILASLRGGGDGWDNPRYRVTFAGLQAALAGWAWVEYRRSSDPWLRRTLIVAGSIFAWFMPWYLRRYTPLEWPVVDLFKTIGLGVATGVLLLVLDWVRGVEP